MRPWRTNHRAFHLIFALAAMYMSMLMTGWNTADPASGELVNVGHDWTTVWVRVRTHARKRVKRAGAGKA